MEREEFYNFLSFLQMSDYRQQILETLHRSPSPQTPTKIATTTGIHRDHVSRHLTKLKEKDLVTVLNPDAQMHRYYELTEKGEEFVERLVEEGYLEEDE